MNWNEESQITQPKWATPNQPIRMNQPKTKLPKLINPKRLYQTNSHKPSNPNDSTQTNRTKRTNPIEPIQTNQSKTNLPKLIKSKQPSQSNSTKQT